MALFVHRLVQLVRQERFPHQTVRARTEIKRSKIKASDATTAKNNSRVTGMGKYLARRLYPGLEGHVDIHDGDIRKMFAVLFHCFYSVGGFRNNYKVFLFD